MTEIIACVAGGFCRAGSKVLAAKPREERGESGFAARCGGSAAKTFDPARTNPPATQATQVTHGKPNRLHSVRRLGH